MKANESAEIVKAVGALTKTVSGKVKQIDDKVNQAIRAVPDAVSELFLPKKVSIDEVNGDDNSLNGPFKTLGAAVQSVPDGGQVYIYLPRTQDGYIYELNESIDIGKRHVVISGGSSKMEKEGLKAATLTPKKMFNSTYNRTFLKGRISGQPGSKLSFRYLRTMLPRMISGTTLEHGRAGAFLGGSLTFDSHAHNISEACIFVENDGTNEKPVYFARSASRDGKANIQDITLSFTNIETSNAASIFDIQYGCGTLRLSVYASALSDSSGKPVEWADLLAGLQYGSHGYATNLLSQEKITKQKD
ncbi:hypothetical protein BCU36_025165 (plasmid) [Vibrio lentus]|uniref:hypothetical protein n=1 Tax=Vibrio lentus TaxID=136468 RepID=UPI000C84FE3C|nr:hypothetical protein [Vibrio lentus]PMI81709.1 hypothetical protein BCU36_11705 [Vibrio lentus]PMJ00223.1 hypothetical protein BCU32_12000 [Vibrio lentus]